MNQDNSILESLEKTGKLIEAGSFYECMKSRPVDKINIPEIRDAKSTFVYNYFTRDERLRPDSNNAQGRIVSLDFSNSDEIFYRSRNDRIARYVKIEFKQPKVWDGTKMNNLALLKQPEKVQELLNNLLYEGGLSNNVFTGIEIIDTDKENKLYTMLNGSMFFLEIPVENNSNRESVAKLHNLLEEKGGLKGQDKKVLFDSFKNITSNGYRLAATDVSPEVAKSSADPLGGQTFSVQFNNLMMSELIDNATILPDNVFQDELRSLKEAAREYRRAAIDYIGSPNTYREEEYDIEITAMELSEIPSKKVAESKKLDKIIDLGGKSLGGNKETEDRTFDQYPEIKLAGYVIEKYEVNTDETVRLVARDYIPNVMTCYILDESVRYGGVYFYKIRTVCRVKIIAPTNNENGQNMLATFYMASEGVVTNVLCVENVPPPPPQNLRAKFDYQTLLPKVTWQLPPNKQRDIKRFQIFKRLSLNDSFRLLKEYNFDNSLVRSVSAEEVPEEDIIFLKRPLCRFVDTTHIEGEKPIYAVACVDAHGMTSNYSPQIKVERDHNTNKVKTSIISRAGAPKPYPNLFLNIDTFQDAIKTSNYDRIKLVFDPEYYDVVRTRQVGGKKIVEDSLNLLAIDENKFRYKFHFINIDNQKDSIVNVRLINRASAGTGYQDAFNTTVANFSKSSLSFQQGIE